MFDLNGDKALTFEEFMFATSAKNFSDTNQKLGWLFDNVYDRVSFKILLNSKNYCNHNLYFNIKLLYALMR